MGGLLELDRVATLHSDAAHGHLRQKRKILPSKKIFPWAYGVPIRGSATAPCLRKNCQIGRSWSCSRDLYRAARLLVLGGHVDVFAGVECALGVHTTLGDAHDSESSAS